MSYVYNICEMRQLSLVYLMKWQQTRSEKPVPVSYKRLIGINTSNNK